MIAPIFGVCNHNRHENSKTLTIANQPETPIKQYTSGTSFSLIETKSRQWINPFAAADFKYYIFGTRFFEKYFQKRFVEVSIINFKYYFNDQHTTASFTTLVEKNLLLFLYIVNKLKQGSIYQNQYCITITLFTRKIESFIA